MSKIRLAVDITPSEFPTTSYRQVDRSVVPGLDQKSAERPVVPTWMENLWVLADQQLGAIWELPHELPPLSPELQALVQREVTKSVLVQNGLASSIALHGKSFVASLAGDQWVVHYEGISVRGTSVCQLRDVVYLFAPHWGVYTYRTGAEQFDLVDPVPLAGVDPTLFLSMTQAVSYLVATDGHTIYWSSPLNPKYWAVGGTGADYGAGSTKVLAVKGTINFLVGSADGFYIFTDSNIIYAAYTDNPDNPWQFSEVADSAGALWEYNVISDRNTGTVYAYTDVGILVMNGTRSQYILPNVVELLTRRDVEEYDEHIGAVKRGTLRERIRPQLQLVHHRFICLSYGQDYITKEYILVYDLQLDRMFRIKYAHTTVLTYDVTASIGVQYRNWLVDFTDETRSYYELLGTQDVTATSVLDIALLGVDGKIVVLNPTYDAPASEATPLANRLVLGNMQLTRNSTAELTTATVYTAEAQAASPTIKVTTERSGETPTEMVAQSASPPNYTQQYVERVRGDQISVAFENLPSVQGIELGFVVTGVRR